MNKQQGILSENLQLQEPKNNLQKLLKYLKTAWKYTLVHSYCTHTIINIVPYVNKKGNI
jgi:hypothetical protein